MTQKEYWYWFANIKGIGNTKMKYLLEYFETPENIFKSSKNLLEKVKKISLSNVEAIAASRDKALIQRRFEDLQKKEINIVLSIEDKYPKKLKNIYDPPFVLYTRGEFPDENKNIISIVGARNCSNYGRHMAESFAYELSHAGFEVVSGLARGIDTSAHKGALSADGKTYAVMGCGVDICYPKDNIELFMDIINNGGIISEFDMGTQPKPLNFPMRNRIISGMADAILVIEAREKSGSLITVDVGLEQGKEIYVIPGRIDDDLSKGCNNLIKMGAHMITSVKDILEDCTKFNSNNCLNENKIDKIFKKNEIILETSEKIVYACLRLEPKHIEQIMMESEMEFGDVVQALFELECRELAVETTNNYYALI